MGEKGDKEDCLHAKEGEDRERRDCTRRLTPVRKKDHPQIYYSSNFNTHLPGILPRKQIPQRLSRVLQALAHVVDDFEFALGDHFVHLRVEAGERGGVVSENKTFHAETFDDQAEIVAGSGGGCGFICVVEG